MKNIKIQFRDYNGFWCNIPFKDSKIFGGGERHIQLDTSLCKKGEFIYITFFYDGDQSILDLLMVCDALKRAGMILKYLKIPYFPGARQDRVCNPGEALSVKVYAELINNLKFQEVRVFDPHSEVTLAVLENVDVIDNFPFVELCIKDIIRDNLDQQTVGFDQSKLVLVAPDAGSNKKVFSLAKKLKNYDVVRADKIRDVATGKILDTQVFADSLEGKIAVVLDDVISYGGTFKALAKKLKEKGAQRVYLIVSHNEGVASIKELKESGIDQVFTTNSRFWNINDYNKSGFFNERICF